MIRSLFFAFISLACWSILDAAYNPIPFGCIIVSTPKRVLYVQPTEYKGDNKLNTIYTAPNDIVIINTVFNPTLRSVYVLTMNSTTNDAIIMRQIVAIEQLSSTQYQLPMPTNISYTDELVSFSADVANNRAFLTDPAGIMTLFALSGLLETIINDPVTIADSIRSATYNNDLNLLFVITNRTLQACMNLETNNLTCCQSMATFSALRSIAFDSATSTLYAYVLDKYSGVSLVNLDTNGCPTSAGPISSILGFNYNKLVASGGLVVYTASVGNIGMDNSYLIIDDDSVTVSARSLAIGEPILGVHIANLNMASTQQTEESCFNGITYTDYRIAVVLAALFGTIMGIFMCFNALFCIDFFMTKSIIRNLKQQIPHNLFEDRWNKLVEEKYAKIALEKVRKKDDPPPPPPASARRKSSLSDRKTSSAANPTPSTTTTTGYDNVESRPAATLEVRPSANPIPKLSDYLRRKSESYLNRRRSNDYYRAHHQALHSELSEPSGPDSRTMGNPPQIHIETVQEENESRGLRQNLSRRELLKNDDDFL